MTAQQKRKRFMTVALAGAVALLALVNWHLTRSPIDTSPMMPQAGPAAEAPKTGVNLSTALDGKPAAQFSETVNRPVFHPNRRPVQRDASRGDEPDVGPGDMRLVGVMRSPNQPARALIRMANEATGKWIAEGEQINGWKLLEVHARSVVVEAGGRSHELTLSSARREREAPAGPDPTSKAR